MSLRRQKHQESNVDLREPAAERIACSGLANSGLLWYVAWASRLSATLAAYMCMRVQFEFTLEDCVDASKRFLARSKAASWQWQGLAYSALFTWLLVFAVVTLLYGRPEIGAAIGVALAALSAMLYPSSYEKIVDRRLRKLHLGQFEAANTSVCEVELKAEGIQVSQLDRQIIYKWSSVEEIQETSDSIDIFTRDGGGVVVRNRAFATAADRTEFLELRRSSLNAARS